MNFDANGYNNEEIDDSLLEDIDKWILYRLNQTIEVSDYNFEKFDFGEAAKAIYKFTWTDFASWYLEMTKVKFGGNDKKRKINTCAVLHHVLTAILKMLHPFMPFFTEEIYSMYNDGSIMVSNWPTVNPKYNFKNVEKLDVLFDTITTVRNIRSSKNVPMSKKIDLLLEAKSQKVASLLLDNKEYLEKFTNFDHLEISTSEINKDKTVNVVLNDVIVIIPLSKLVDMEEEKTKLLENKERLHKEIDRCTQMLSNPNFVSKAPAQKVEAEKEKLENYKKQLEEVEKLLAGF